MTHIRVQDREHNQGQALHFPRQGENDQRVAGFEHDRLHGKPLPEVIFKPKESPEINEHSSTCCAEGSSKNPHRGHAQ